VVLGLTSIGSYGDSAGRLDKNLGGCASKPLRLMRPEDWDFTK
jgi:hypothetical protein